MSKELPYFKFFSTEWLLGRISDKNFRTQGIFAAACAHYWHKECTITETELNQKLGKSRVKLLIVEKFLLQSNGKITIPFLDEQMSEFIDLKEKRSEAGRKGGQASVKQRLSKNEAKVKHLDKEEDKEKNRYKTQPKDLKMVFDYMVEKKCLSANIEAEKFYDHFNSNGWKVGGKALMKDWRSAVNTWLRGIGTGKKAESEITFG